MKKGLITSHVPRSYSSEIKRTALLKTIRRSEDCRLIALLAPSGYGKTTLLGQLCRSGRRQVVWIELTPDSKNLSVLLTQVLSALQDRHDSLNIRWQFDQLDQVAPEKIAHFIVQALSEIQLHLYIVLDKTEHLSESGGQWLHSLMSQLPEGHQLLIAGYETTPVPVMQWATRPDVLVLKSTDLAFTPEEARDYCSKKNLSWDENLYQQSSGWAIALTLKNQGASSHMDARDWIIERMTPLPQELRSLLPCLATQTVWHDKMDFPVDLLPPDNWIHQLLQAGLPLLHIGQHFYTPHTLLLEALNRLLQADPPMHRMLHQKEAEKAFQEGKWISAFQHFMQADQREQAMQAIDRFLPSISSKEDWKLIADLLGHLPTKQLPGHLQSYLAWSFMETGHAERSLELADAQIQEGHLDGTLCVVMANLAYRSGNYSEQLQWAEQGLQMPCSVHVHMSLMRSKASALRRLKRLDEALEHTQNHLQAARSSRNPLWVARALTSLGNLQADREEYLESEQAYLAALDLLKKYGAEEGRSEVYYNLAATYADLNRNQEALNLLNEALMLPDHALQSMKPLLLGIRAAIHGQLRLWELSMDGFAEAAALCPEHGWTEYQFDYLLAICDTACLAGKPEQASAALARARLHVPEGDQAHLDTLRFSEAMVAYVMQQDQKASQLLQLADTPALSSWSTPFISLMQANLMRKQGLDWTDSLLQGLKRMEPLGHDALLVLGAHMLRDLYESCIEVGLSQERFQKALQEASTPAASLEPTWQLTVQLLGKFEVRTSHRIFHLSLKKTEDLLAYLVMHGQSTREQLVDALWNGELHRKHIDHFKVLIRKLRLELAQELQLPFDPLPFQNGTYSIHPALHIDCDAQMVLARSSITDPLTPEQLQHHLDLYTGEFFSRLDADWAVQLRDKIAERHIQDGLLLAHLHQQHQQMDLAVGVHQKLLAHHPYEEQLYFSLMKLHEVQGNVLALQDVQKKYRKTMEDFLSLN